MGSAIDGMDVVGEGQDRLGEPIVVLERHFDAGRVDHALDVDRALVEHVAATVEVPHEARDPSLEVEVLLAVGALVAQADPESLVQVRRLAQPGGDQVPAEVEGVEDLGVGHEEGSRTCAPIARRH